MSIRAIDVIFHNVILKCSKTFIHDIARAKSINNNVSGSTVVQTGESSHCLQIMFDVDARLCKYNHRF